MRFSAIKMLKLRLANSGIGYSTAHYLAKQGGTVHMVCRNKKRGTAARDTIVESTNNEDIHLHICDVGDFEQLRKLAADFVESEAPLDVLINNAGVMLDKRQEVNGIEATLAINSMSNFLLTHLLMPVLQKSSDSRVIFVSSGGALTEKLLVRNKYESSKYDGTKLYAKTKRHQLILTEKFAEQFADTSVKFYSMHPGWAETPGVKKSMPGFYKRLQSKFRTQEQGADTMCWLAATDSLTDADNGAFFRDRAQEVKNLSWASTKSTEDQNNDLWKWCQELTGWESPE